MARDPKKKPQIDGIITSQRRTVIGDFSAVKDKSKRTDFRRTELDPKFSERRRKSAEEIELNDKDMKDIKSAGKPAKHHRIRFWKNEKTPWTVKKAVKRAGLFTAVGFVLLAVFLGIKFFLATQNIIDRAGDGAIALQENIDASQLNGEGDGRVNILLIGIGGEGHEAPDLSDTIIIASLDPFAKEVAMLSIPRDMYVEIPGYGSTRINAAHAYGEQYDHPGGGIALLEETLEKTLDIPIHYYVRVDFNGFRQAVDAVGGIDVYVKEPVYDTTFWWQYGILDVPAGWQSFDGERALYFARSRKTSARGDFSRSERQRDIIVALKDKAFSLGTFSNPLKISSLLDAAGGHVRTNLQISELLRLYEIGQEVHGDKIISAGLDNSDESYLKGANVGGASVLVPKAGVGNYSEIQKYLRGLFVDGFIRQENASIDILNGTSRAGLAAETTEVLQSYKYNVVVVGDAPTKDYGTTVIYDRSQGNKPYTKQLLEKRFGVKMESGSKLPDGINSNSDFVIIVGDNGQN